MLFTMPVNFSENLNGEHCFEQLVKADTKAALVHIFQLVMRKWDMLQVTLQINNYTITEWSL